MFVKVADLAQGQACRIVAYGHTEPTDDLRFRVLTQVDFIADMLSSRAKQDLLGAAPPWTTEDFSTIAEKWVSQTGIKERIFFFGTTAELGAIAARKCLQQANISALELDAIVAGSNTGPGYPSLADHLKCALGQKSQAMAYDVQEACPVGSVAVFNAWNLIRSGATKKVLVVCAEKATTLAALDDWKGSNLFGDAASAFLLEASDVEAFQFFDFHAEPFDGQLDMIVKTHEGFAQNGLGVHRFVGKEVVRLLLEAVAKAGIDPNDISHLVPHQPSAKTLDLLFSKLALAWPNFSQIQTHRNVEYTGNTSGASTGSLISAGVASGQIRPGELVLVTTFGSGLSIGNYAFRV